MAIFNQKVVDYKKQPMFFGEELSVQRYDEFKYPVFDKLTQTQLGFFWRPEEVSLQKDRNDYQSLSEEQKFIFTANLRYQTLLDSVQGRGPVLTLLPYCSLPELEGCIVTWDFMETIHSRSYTHVIKNLYPNPAEVFDDILVNEKIIARATAVTERYDAFIEYAKRYELGIEGYTDEYELKKRLYLALVSINILEGIRFYVSFACTFAFGELRKMEGSAKIISFIARDESQHLAVTQHIINNYKNTEKDEVMLKVIEDTDADVYKMYEEAVQQEKEWAAYLFSGGSMIGLNERLLCDYVEFMANRRMKAIGYKPMFNQSSTTNPLPWTEHWLSSKGMQNAPQETEIESYVIGGIKQDIGKDQFKDFSL